MPGSRVASVNSAGSATSRYSKRYRTKSKQSNVDETLFASPKVKVEERRGPIMENLRLGPRRSGLRGHTRKPETIQVITKDLIRNVVVPDTDPSGMTAILDPLKYSRISSAAIVRTKEDIQEEYEMSQYEKDKALEGARKRKEEMQQRELIRKQNIKLTDLEVEAKKKAEYLLENAKKMKLEQEDEVKHLNELILNAKCHAIRDAQILEKKTINNEMKEEDKRLDTMMEIDRINAIKTQEEIEDLKKRERLAGALQVMKQIEQHAQEKILEQDVKDQETLQMLKYLETLRLEDLKALKIKYEEQQQTQNDIEKIRVIDQQQKEMRLQQEKLADQKVLEYMRKKAEREAELEKEQQRIKKDKERETARLRAMQEVVRDHQKEQDAIRARRNHEQAEREWRRREELEAVKKANITDIMKRARKEQLLTKEHLMAVQAKRDRFEFERVLEEQKRLITLDKEKEEKTRKERYENADRVRKQIIDKEAMKIAERKAYFEEGIKMEEEARRRRARLDEVKRTKLQELREAGVPDRYCAEVERQLTVPQSLTKSECPKV